MDRSQVAIVVPALNEAATIGRIVEAASRHGQVIVVDDGSGDATASLAGAAGAIVVRRGANGGYDAALNSGFVEADRRGFACIVTLDADGQHDPTVIARVTAQLDQGADLVIGIRPRPARLAEWLFARYGQLRFGVRDPLCGVKGYRMSVYRSRGWFDSYQSIGTELALYAVRNGVRWVQIPIDIRERQGSPRFAQRWRANWRIFRAMLLSFTRLRI